MLHKINFHIILLTLILVLGFGLRTYRLSEVPSGFFTDEASIGYNAYTILTKGVDEHGTAFPIFFRAFGEYKSPAQIYATIPSIAIFGLTEFAVRFTSVIFGTLTIVAIYLLTKQLCKAIKQSNNEAIALFAAFFLAISPWHIHFSRTAFELMPFVFFTTFGLYLFFKSRSYPRLLMIAALIFTLAIYSYFVARIFIPLFGLFLVLIYAHALMKYKKEIFVSFLLALILLFPLINHTLSPVGFSRWQQVSIFSQPPKNETILIHVVNNYLSHFSLDFLFLKGDIDMPEQFITRHSIRGMGELYLFQLPLIFLGAWYFILKREKRTMALLLFWLALYPIGSMFTIDKNAQATRSIIGVIPFQILSAIGLYWVMNFFRSFERSKKNQLIYFFSIGVIIVIITASFLNFLDLYFKKYPLYASNFWGWQYGYRNIVSYLKTQEDLFDQLLITHRYNYGEELLKFYNVTYDCQKCLVMTNPITINVKKRQLFALRAEDILEAKNIYPALQFIIQETLLLPNGRSEIFIGTFSPIIASNVKDIVQ